MEPVIIDGRNITIEKVHRVARLKAPVELAPEAVEAINTARGFLEGLVEKGEAIYGVTTGIGELASIRVSAEMGEELQKRIVDSHSAGTGDPQPPDVVRAAMMLRANVHARGHSGVRLLLTRTIVDMLNRDVVPFIYEKGSVGTSGDLSPLSQLGEVIMGRGRAYYQGELLDGGEAMSRAGIKPLKLSYKEGLGIINGTQVMTGGLALLVYDAERLLKNAMISSAMALDALKAVEAPFQQKVHLVRPYPGQNAVASNLRRVFEGSEIMADPTGKVQDGYSMRCTPQILGPSLDALQYVRWQVEIEMNSVVDNPLFFPGDNTHVGAGNFHGQGIGIAADLLCITMSEAANLSERHTNRLLNPTLSGMPDFLVEGKGLNSGLMVAQYTAAALVSENKVLSHPASVDSISVSADQEDHVSMGPIAVRKLTEIQKNLAVVLAVEMMSAAQAMDLRKPQKPGRGTAAAYGRIRETVPFLEDDRPLHIDINAIAGMIRDNSILGVVEAEVGELDMFYETGYRPPEN